MDSFILCLLFGKTREAHCTQPPTATPSLPKHIPKRAEVRGQSVNLHYLTVWDVRVRDIRSRHSKKGSSYRLTANHVLWLLDVECTVIDSQFYFFIP